VASLAKISYFLTPSPLQLCIYHRSSIVTSSAHCKASSCPAHIKGQAGPEETDGKPLFLGKEEIKLGHPSSFVFLAEDFLRSTLLTLSRLRSPKRLLCSTEECVRACALPEHQSCTLKSSHTERNPKTLLSASPPCPPPRLIIRCKSDHSGHRSNQLLKINPTPGSVRQQPA